MRKFAQWVRMLILFIDIFAIIQITIPAGAATTIARPSTKSVRSKIERRITFPICGFLYGGSSRVKEDGIPRRIVWDKIFEINNDMRIPIRIIEVSIKVEDVYKRQAYI